MDPLHPTLSTALADFEAEAQAESTRATNTPVLKTKSDQMTYLISTIQGMEKNINQIMLNQKSIERIVDTKFHDMDVKVTELTTTVNQLKQEVDAVPAPSSSDDDDNPPL
ncbi:nucleolysin tiar [Hordeum vulgare]|nr:nucleolysin tiar [Hordeum vulgare]